jgi:phage-related holin
VQILAEILIKSIVLVKIAENASDKGVKVKMQSVIKQLTVYGVQIFKNPLIYLLFWVIFFNICTELSANLWKFPPINKLQLMRTMIRYLIVVMGIITIYPILLILGQRTFGNALICFYISSYGLSIIKNLSAMNVQIPPFLKEKLNRLKNLIKCKK